MPIAVSNGSEDGERGHDGRIRGAWDALLREHDLYRVARRAGKIALNPAPARNDAAMNRSSIWERE